jgi:hypothetical protein
MLPAARNAAEEKGNPIRSMGLADVAIAACVDSN